MGGKRWTRVDADRMIRRSSIEIMCDWIVRAWDMVLTKIITKSF
jgi:hypothetical protein